MAERKNNTLLRGTAGEHHGSRRDSYWAQHPSRSKNAKLQLAAHAGIIYDEGYQWEEEQNGMIKDFGLRGVDYGNWMSQQDRTDYLAATRVALEQLSFVLGLQNLGFSGTLAISFGARGRGHAMAHYEPAANVINLTKLHGEGCLAHEYGHAIDYICGGCMDRNKAFYSLSGGQSTAKILSHDNVGSALRCTANYIVDYICTCTSQTDSIDPSCEYWYRRTEIFARWFEQYVAVKSNARTSTVLCQSTLYYDNLHGKGYLSADEMSPLIAIGDNLVSALRAQNVGQRYTITNEDMAAMLLAYKARTGSHWHAHHTYITAIKQLNVRGGKHIATIDLTTKYKIAGRHLAQNEIAALLDGKQTTATKTTPHPTTAKPEAKAAAAKAATKTAAAKRNTTATPPVPIKDFLLKIGGGFHKNYVVIHSTLTGIYYDADHKVAVATNSQIMLVSSHLYDPSKAGRIINPKGEEISGKYPKWPTAFPKDTTPVTFPKSFAQNAASNKDSLQQYTDKEIKQGLGYIPVTDQWGLSIRYARMAVKIGLDGWLINKSSGCLTKDDHHGNRYIIMCKSKTSMD